MHAQQDEGVHQPQQQQQQQQQQQSCTSFSDVCSQASLVWHIATHLILRDAAALSLTHKHAAAALRGCLHSNSTLALCPRIVIAASGSSKLLELPLTHDGQPYHSSAAAAAGLSAAASSPTAAAVIRELPGKRGKRKRKARLTMSKRSNNMWLTGVTIGPHFGPDVGAAAAAATAAAAAAGKGPRQALYVCDYSTRGVLKFSTGSLRPLGVFASGSELKCPEAIAWVGSTCYVTSAENVSVVALDCQGRVQQVLDLGKASVPCVVWGMAAWQPQTSAAAAAAAALAATPACSAESPEARKAAAAAGAALFLAADEEYIAARYNEPPDNATGGVVRVGLSSSGAMLQPPQLFSKLPIKRPSGLSFDHQGHLWVTSLDGLLLRLAGPADAALGSLLQTLQLQQLLPSPADAFLPFDVLTMPLSAAARLSSTAAAAPAGLGDFTAGMPWPEAAAAGIDGTSSLRRQQLQVVASGCSGVLLVVTLHRGPQESGAVAVLRFQHCKVQEDAGQESIGAAACRTAADVQHAGDAEQRKGAVRLVALVTRHKALKEPNMLTLL